MSIWFGEGLRRHRIQYPASYWCDDCHSVREESSFHWSVTNCLNFWFETTSVSLPRQGSNIESVTEIGEVAEEDKLSDFEGIN